MADSTISDADKIRAKRLAKLGGGQNNSAANAPNQADNTEPDGTSPNGADTQVQAVAQPAPPNPFTQLGLGGEAEAEKKTTPQIKIQPRPTSPAKRERDGSERPRSRTNEKAPESLEVWQDRNLRQIFRVTLKPEEVKDAHGHTLIFLASTREDIVDGKLNVEVLEGAITEAASNAPDNKPFEYLLQSFKRVSRAIRGTKHTGPEDPKHEILKETRRLCMSYCIFAVTMPEMFGEVSVRGSHATSHNYVLEARQKVINAFIHTFEVIQEVTAANLDILRRIALSQKAGSEYRCSISKI